MTAPSPFGAMLLDVMAAHARVPFSDLDRALTSSVRQWADAAEDYTATIPPATPFEFSNDLKGGA
jgi:hypothetical protein